MWTSPIGKMVAICTISVVVMILVWQERNSKAWSMAGWEPQRRSIEAGRDILLAQARTVAVVVITHHLVRLLNKVLNKAENSENDVSVQK